MGVVVVQSTFLFYIDSLHFEINSLFYGQGFVRPRTLFDSIESMSHGQIYIKQIMPRKGAGVEGKVHKVLATKKATPKGCFLLVGLSGHGDFSYLKHLTSHNFLVSPLI